MTGPRQDHERTDADVGTVVRWGVVMVVLTLLTLASMSWFYAYLGDRVGTTAPPPSPLAGTRSPFSGPRLQVSETAALEALRADEEALLTTYGWANRTTRRVRVPIEQAMRVLADEGFLGESRGRLP